MGRGEEGGVLSPGSSEEEGRRGKIMLYRAAVGHETAGKARQKDELPRVREFSGREGKSTGSYKQWVCCRTNGKGVGGKL